ncbi:hypothetical protein TARUN_9346 [Trichoderma arundinaceum]|uniref:Uncharacterized protein n=1 Tax=Trichoderma arundinaceum TaxID=490622 RepID=A0A395N9W4_TRIAR|nr:hypothetical protein TARUN_9346 [Trichoderma arundinaceum]
MERLGSRLPAPLVFDLVRDAYSSPNTNDAWLSSYLKAVLRVFLEGSSEPSVGEMTDRSKIMSISDILFKSMLELLHEDKISLHKELMEKDVLPVTSALATLEVHTDGDINQKAEALFSKKKKDKKSDRVSEIPRENHTENPVTQGVGADQDKKSEADLCSVDTLKEKGKKKEKKKTKKNNNKNSSIADPLSGPSDGYLMVNSKQETKIDDKSGMKSTMPTLSDGDTTVGSCQEFMPEGSTKKQSEAISEMFSFWTVRN